MPIARNRIRGALLACGVLCVVPLLGVQQIQGISPDGCACCSRAAWALSSGLLHAEEPKAGASKQSLSAKAKASLEKLMEGNKRFAAGKPLNKHTSLEWRSEIVKEQKPFATILGCADSRVSPEHIFDQGLGDLFVVRVAGNVVDADVTGSLEYAGLHLGTSLFVVLGHEQCGAVTAIVDAPTEDKNEPDGLRTLLQRIRPGLKNIDPQAPRPKRIAAAVEANVRWSMSQLASVPRHKKALDEGKVNLVGAVYELETGKVRLLDQ